MIAFALAVATVCTVAALGLVLIGTVVAVTDEGKLPPFAVFVVAVLLAIASVGLGWASAHHTYKLAESKSCVETQ